MLWTRGGEVGRDSLSESGSSPHSGGQNRETERAALRLLILLPHSPSPQNVPCKLPNRMDYSHRDPSVLRNKIRQGAEKTTFSLENNHLKLCDKSNSSEKHVHMEGLAIVCSTAKL